MKITQHFPAELKERGRELAEIFQKEKENFPGVKTKVVHVGNSLFVNDERYFDKLTKPFS